MHRPRTARSSAAAATLTACFALARRTAATDVVGTRERHEPSPRLSDRGVAHVDALSAHALAADAADAAAEALHLPRSTGTRFDAESLSSSPDLRVGSRHARPRGDALGELAEEEVDPRWTAASADAHDAAGGLAAVDENADIPVPPRGVAFDLETYLGAGATATAPPDADPETVAAAAAAAAAFAEQEERILAEYEAAMAAFSESERALEAAADAADAASSRAEREVRARSDSGEAAAAAAREEAWAERHGAGPDGSTDAEDSARLLSAYAKAACTQTIHHKPVYVPGVFTPPKHAPSVKIPGTPPVFVPGAPAYWEPGRAPFYTPGFWTPGRAPRYVSAVRPTIVPAKKGTVIPGEFVPPSYTPGFVIPGWHETTACAVPVCVAPCQDAPYVVEPEIVAR
jgi:hypothetical protein